MRFILTGQTRSDAIRKEKIMVDDSDFEELNKYNWQLSNFNAVVRHVKGEKQVQLHRMVMKAPLGIEIDHIDGNRLNNQKSNLRFATSSQNKMNRGPRKDNHSGYKGVSWHKQINKWTSRIQIGNTYKHLGLFENIIEAVKAYNNAALKFHGEFAWLNKL